MERSRFAPSTTGVAHPGTLLAALLCWLDARSRGAQVLLRLEDLDLTRVKSEWTSAMQRDLAWLGLDWDEVHVQSGFGREHEGALDALAARGALYPCDCSRARIRAHGKQAADGGWAYPNTCRDRPLPPGGWRAVMGSLRARLPDGPIRVRDESGLDLSQAPAQIMGDPIVRRRDGVIAYQLAVVVDDARAGITRVVRGRDLATSTATQVALQRLLDLPTPVYRHHLLLLEPHGEKLAKLHGSIGLRTLEQHYDAPGLCGVLAAACELIDEARDVTPRELLADFSWQRVRDADRVVVWAGSRLALAE